MYASERFSCTSCPCVLLRALNTLVVEKDRKKGLFLAFLGRSNLKCYTVTPIYAHVNCHVLCGLSLQVIRIGHDVTSQR